MSILKKVNVRARYRSLAITSTAAILLGGCVGGSPGPALVGISALGEHYLPHTDSNNLFNAKIVSPKPLYSINYSVTMQGKSDGKGVPSSLVAEGQYQNWSWTVKTTPSVEAALKTWVAGLYMHQGEHHDTGVNAALDWNAMMVRLYQLDSYLLRSPPIPLRAQIVIIGGDENYRFKSTLSQQDALPLLAVARDSDVSTNSNQFQTSQTATVFSIQSIIQGLLADAEWKAGILPRPLAKSDAQLKFYANQICWAKAANLATIVGLSKLPSQMVTQLSNNSNVIKASLIRANYDLSSNDFAATYGMAQLLIDSGLVEYLKQQNLGQLRPNQAVDLNYANATANYCRAFTRYTGDIKNHPLHADDVLRGNLFLQNPQNSRM